MANYVIDTTTISDQFPKRRTAASNLFVLYNNKTQKNVNDVLYALVL